MENYTSIPRLPTNAVIEQTGNVLSVRYMNGTSHKIQWCLYFHSNTDLWDFQSSDSIAALVEFFVKLSLRLIKSPFFLNAAFIF